MDGGIHAELTKRIIGAAQEVHRELRNGLDEKLYENALCIEFAERGVFFEQQKKPHRLLQIKADWEIDPGFDRRTICHRGYESR
jgi:hypothetical protein